MNDVMIDIETFGLKPGSVITSIGAVEFDLDGGMGAKQKWNIKPSRRGDGLTIDPSTVMWWLHQPKQAQQAMLTDQVNLDHALCELAMFINPDGEPNGGRCVWGNGSNFDIVLLEAAYDAIHARQDIPWHYRCIRDMRTFVDMMERLGSCPDPCVLMQGPSVAHDALADAIYQVEVMQALWAARPGA